MAPQVASDDKKDGAKRYYKERKIGRKKTNDHVEQHKMKESDIPVGASQIEKSRIAGIKPGVASQTGKSNRAGIKRRVDPKNGKSNRAAINRGVDRQTGKSNRAGINRGAAPQTGKSSGVAPQTEKSPMPFKLENDNK